ncbi:recombinase family protein [Peribacillus frigoritolerans]|uniref:recombinase family protein n=1 Tax=Peribacillus frigoritolerans TaxID=450367 RepID=UPI000AFE7A1A|nr:recombinase family protein [Peribacillus frigoritolerans]MED3889362.1 recombinase family protein [Peribacillus frigoritolerans]ULM99351.1 recombinase family protein [Peribacillus frigoritolerans]
MKIKLNHFRDMAKENQSEAKSNRIALHGALEYLREGDKLIVPKIDRFARSVKNLHNVASQLEDNGIGLVFLKEQSRVVPSMQMLKIGKGV